MRRDYYHDLQLEYNLRMKLSFLLLYWWLPLHPRPQKRILIKNTISIVFKGYYLWRKTEIFIRSIQSSWIFRNEDTVFLRNWLPFVAIMLYRYWWENLGDSLFQLSCKQLWGLQDSKWNKPFFPTLFLCLFYDSKVDQIN